MMNKEQLDLLKKVEELTAKLNESFSKKGKSVFERYPLLFALLVIFGATMMSQGVKELIMHVSFLKTNPLLMFIIGVVILIITGTLYKKLEK
jgi:phosphotransferase system  glucose/maltose/N-acetylglucosamine-specific IIC component